MIQINTCSLEDIKRLPGVGPATAQKVIEARPIADLAQLEQLVPPSAWLKLQEAKVEFGFGAPGNVIEVPEGESLVLNTGDSLSNVTIKAAPPNPPIILQGAQQPMTLRRVLPGQQLRQGAKYLCVWNMQWGPAGEAVRPQDVAIQIEVESHLKKWGISIMFAHYAASVRVGTDSYGQVPVLLFEVIEETRNEAETATDIARAGQGDG